MDAFNQISLGTKFFGPWEPKKVFDLQAPEQEKTRLSDFETACRITQLATFSALAAKCVAIAIPILKANKHLIPVSIYLGTFLSLPALSYLFNRVVFRYPENHIKNRACHPWMFVSVLAQTSALTALKLPMIGLGGLAIYLATPLVWHYLANRGAHASIYQREDNLGNSLLHIAVRNGKKDEVNLLLEGLRTQADKKSILSKKNLIGETLLDVAFKNKKWEICDLLLEHGVNFSPNKVREIVKSSFEKGMLIEMISKKLGYHFQDDEGNTLLHYAAQSGHQDSCLQELLDAGVDPNIKNKKGQTALDLALESGYHHVSLLLPKVQIDPKSALAENLLCHAVNHEDVGTVKYLLNLGVLLPKGQLKIVFSHIEIVRELIKKIPSLIDAFDKEGNAPIHLAVRSKDLDFLNFLLSENALIELRNGKGETPLLAALKVKNNAHVVRVLLSQNAKIDVKDKQGTTMIQCVLENQSKELLDEILKLTGMSSEVVKSLFAGDSQTPEQIAELIKKGYPFDPKLPKIQQLLTIAYKNEDIDLLMKLMDAGVACFGEKNKDLFITAIKDKKKAIALYLIKYRPGLLQEAKKDGLCVYAAFDTDVLTAILDSGVDVNFSGESKVTFLHIASRFGYLDSIQLLIKKGANPRAIDNHGTTSVHYAVCGGQVECVEWLLKSYPDLKDVADESGHTLLHSLVLSHLPLPQSTKMMKSLLSLNVNRRAKDKQGLTPIFLAIVKGTKESLQAFIDCSDASELKDEKENNLLHIAVQYNRHDLIPLLKNYFNINASNTDGESPLYIAIRLNSKECMKALISNGATIRHVWNKYGHTPVHFAAQMKCLEFFKLLNYDAELFDMRDHKGNTPLHIAASVSASTELVDRLIALGSHIEAKNNDANTPLHLAASSHGWKADEVTKVVEAFSLVQHLASVKNANLQAKNHQGAMPLHLAARAGYKLNMDNILKIHLGYGQYQDNNYKKPLDYAIENRWAHFLYFLMRDYSPLHGLLQLMEAKAPGRIIQKDWEHKATAYFFPAGGDDWIKAYEALSFYDKSIYPATYLLDIALHFSDLPFALKVMEKFKIAELNVPNTVGRESVLAERRLVQEGFSIHPDFYTTSVEMVIPELPADYTFEEAERRLLAMTGKIQNSDPKATGFVKMPKAEIEEGLKKFLDDIKNRTLAKDITGEHGTPRCKNFYHRMEKLTKHVALFLSEKEDPLRLKLNAPVCDDNDRATALKELAAVTKVCGTGRMGALFAEYERLRGSVKLDATTLEEDVSKYFAEYREGIAQMIINRQKDLFGEEIEELLHAHVGLQVREYLSKRGVTGGELSGDDPHAKKHITKELILSQFDTVCTMDSLIKLLDEWINGVKLPDGKRLITDKIKPRIDAGKISDWIRDHFGPDSIGEFYDDACEVMTEEGIKRLLSHPKMKVLQKNK